MADHIDVSSSVLIDSTNSTLLSSKGSWEDHASSTETSDSDSIVFEDSVSMCSSNPIIAQPSSLPSPIIATSQKNTPHSCESYSSDIDCIPESQDIDMATPEYHNKNSVSDATLIATKSCADALCIMDDTEDMIQCSSCLSWRHYDCTALPAYQLYAFISSSRRYECISCVARRMPDDEQERLTNLRSRIQCDKQSQTGKRGTSIGIQCGKASPNHRDENSADDMNEGIR